MGIFEIPANEILRIGGKGRTRTGKTTFFASNATAPIYAIDSDKGFVRTRMAMNKRFSELSGKVITPSKKGCIQPFHIDREARENILKHDIETTVIDSVSKIYSLNATPAVMAGRLQASEREKYGFSKNKASNLMDKAFAIRTIASLAAYGTHIFYVWHEKETVDVKSGTMEKIIAETMSEEERKRLMESIDIVLSFRFEKGKYAIKVEDETRGYGYEPNTNFTIYDAPKNYWRNTMPRLYNLIYMTFSGQDEAVNWGLKTLNKDDPVELEAFYDEVKGRTNPEKPGDMWVAWMLAIEEKHNAAVKRAQEQKVEAPVVVKDESAEKEEPVTEEKEWPIEGDAPLKGLPSTVSVPVDPTGDMPEQKQDLGGASLDDNGEPLTFGDGDFVREEYIADYGIYQNQFGYDPESEANLLRAKDAMGEDWE